MAQPSRWRRFRSGASNARITFCSRPPLGVAPQTFDVLTPTAPHAEALLEFDAASAILSAHCDGLVIEDQLTCGAQIMYKGRRDWRARKLRTAREYTHTTAVETISYIETIVTEPSSSAIHQGARLLDVDSER